MSVYVYLSVCVSYVCVYVPVSVCVSVHICVDVCVWWHMCVSVCMCVHLHAWSKHLSIMTLQSKDLCYVSMQFSSFSLIKAHCTHPLSCRLD